MVLLGFGSNIGDREKNIRDAVEALVDMGITIEQVSSLYETEPVGYLAQAAFLNAVANVNASGLTPVALLHICQAVENKLGRKRDIHWGPRTIDIDLLVFNDIEMMTNELTLPHPFLAERRFVLVPVAQITDAVVTAGKSAKELLADCCDRSAVEVYKTPDKWL